MKAAVKTTKVNEFDWLRASQTFKVPFVKLRRRVGNVGVNKFLNGFKIGYLGDKIIFSVK